MIKYLSHNNVGYGICGMMFALIVIACITGCAKQPISTERTDNVTIRVDKLFTHEGCTVYRFGDNGRDHYYTNCAGTSTQHVQCGKNCIRPEEITTTNLDPEPGIPLER